MSGGWLSRVITSGQGASLRAQLMRGAMGVGGLRLLSLLFTMTASILLARGLGPEGYGQYTFVITLITTLSIPLAPALMQLTIRETARMHQAGDNDRIRALLRWANRHVLFGSVLIIVTVGGIAAWLTGLRVDDRWTLLLIGLVALPLLGLNAVRAGILAGLRRVVLGQLPDLFVRPLVLLFVAGVLLVAGCLNPLTAVVAFVAGAALALVIGTLLLGHTFPEPQGTSPPMDATQKSQWMRAWMPFTLLMAASTLNAQIGILLLGWLTTNEEVAAMQVAQRGSMLLVFSLAVVNLVIGPHVAQLHRSGDRDRLQGLSRYSARMALLVTLPIALPLIFFGAPILRIVFGAEYAAIATLPLAILAVGQVINVAFGSVGLLLIMSGHENDPLWTQGASLLVTIFVAIVLIPKFFATGAAIAVALGVVLSNILQAIMVFYRIRVVPTCF